MEEIVDKMQDGGFQLSEGDPCMLYREDQRGIGIIIIYIDDMLMIGKEEAIHAAIKELQGHIQVKDPSSLEDFLGVQIVQSDDGGWGIIENEAKSLSRLLAWLL